MKNKEEKQKNEINRFPFSEEHALMREIHKTFPSQKDCISEDEALRLKNVCIMDPANVSMIVAKTEEAKRLLSRFITKTQKKQKTPSLNYVAKNGEKIMSRYSVEYLLKILEILGENDSSSISISMKKQYPLTMGNKHFDLILAPRVENEEDE